MRRCSLALAVGLFSALLLNAVGGASPLVVHKNAPRFVFASDSATTTTVPSVRSRPRHCPRSVRLNAGVPVAAARLGAIDFVSPEVGVGLSAPEIQCQVRDGDTGGVDLYPQAQPSRLAVSTDGGRHWVTEGRPVAPPRIYAGPEHLVAASTKTVWVLTDEKTLLLTKNAGLSWKSEKAPTPLVDLVPEAGWLWALSCPPSVARSISSCTPVLERVPLAGGRWQKLPLPPIRSDPFPQLVVASPATVLVLVTPFGDSQGTLMSSADGGRTWRLLPTPSGPGDLCTSDVALATAGVSDWWLLCNGQAAAGSSTKALMQTLDAGQIWNTVASVTSLIPPIPPGSLEVGEVSAMAAGSPSRLWLASPNTLTESIDGGAVWTEVPGVNQEGYGGLFDVWSGSRAWLLAPGEGLWATTNGTTWHALGLVAPP
jgi:hypothetical protein